MNVKKTGASVAPIKRKFAKADSSASINTKDSFMSMKKIDTTSDDIKKAADLVFKQGIKARANAPIWYHEISEKSLCSKPSTFDGNSLFIRDSENLISLDAVTGKVNWKFNTDNWSSDPPQKGRDGLLFTSRYESGRNDLITALDEKTGKTRFEIEADNSEITTWIAGNDGNIYTGVNRKPICAYDGKTGEKMWEVPNDQYVTLNGQSKKGPLIYSYDSRKSFGLDPKTGKKLWEHEADSAFSIKQHLTKEGDVVAVTSNGLTCIDGKEGKELWNRKIEGYTKAAPYFGDDGNIYVASQGTKRNGDIYKIDPGSGKVLWKYEGKIEFKSSPTLDKDGILYAGDERGTLHAIDSKTGRLKWEAKNRSIYAAGTPVPLGDGTVAQGYYINSGGDTIYLDSFSIIDAKTGKELKSFKCPTSKYLSQRHVNFDPDRYDFIGPVTIGASDKRPGILFVGTGDGKIAALGSEETVINHLIDNREQEDVKSDDIKKEKESVIIGGVKLDVRKSKKTKGGK